MRKFRRIPAEELPDHLARPVVLVEDMEVKSMLINLSPIGIAVEIAAERGLDDGDLFEIKYFRPDVYIKCICVFSEKREDKFVIGGYFRNREDHRVILDSLSDKVIN